MSTVAPDVPPQLETVIQRCLRKNPDDRWQSMKDVQGALSALKRESDSGSLYTTRVMAPAGPASMGPASVKATAVSPPANASPSNSKALIGIAAVLVVLAAAGGGTFFMVKKRAAAKAAAELAAQTPPPAPVAAPEPAPPPPPPPDTTLNNDNVLEMVKEKVPTDLILSQIRAADKTNFDLSTPE